MEQEFESKANFVKIQIEEDFNALNELELEKFFEKFKDDQRTLSFLEYYNRSVLDKEKIDFGEFNSARAWATHCSKEFYSFFDNNYNLIIKEVKTKRDISNFFDKYCYQKDIQLRNGKEIKKSPSSFCSKLFHTVLPDEFPPVDNPIKKKFHLQKEEFIKSVLIIKRGYKLFAEENPDKINQIRKLLSKPKFTYLRINELSDIRILDMYYWFKENRDFKFRQSLR